MPASQWYKVCLCHIEGHEFAVFCGGCIRYQAGDILLDSGLLQDRWTDSDALCGRLLAMIQALQWYKIHLSATFIHEVTVLNGVLAIPELDSWFLHNQLSDSGSDWGRLLGLTLATWRYKVRLCHFKTHKSANSSEGGLSPAHSTRWQIPPQPVSWFWIWLRGIVGLEANYIMV